MSTKNNPAQQIIDRFGGQSALAGALGRTQSTVEHWSKTGRIPAQWHKELLKLAREKGINLEAKDFVVKETPDVAPAKGKLGIMFVGLGAITSTVLAGIEHVRRGTGKPFGSVSQMSTIRLGKRTENRTPFIKDFVPLAKLDQLVFAAWDPIG